VSIEHSPGRSRRRLVRFRQLKPDYGIDYSRQHLNRLEAEGKWPQRVRYGGGNFFAWWSDELEAHLDQLPRGAS
jgi:hypothetical protein